MKKILLIILLVPFVFGCNSALLNTQNPSEDGSVIGTELQDEPTATTKSASDSDNAGLSILSNVFAIKRYGTGTNSTEMHVLDGSEKYQSYIDQTGTELGEVGGDNKWNFAMGDYNGDSVPDLYAIKRYGTGTNSTEVHILDGSDRYQSYIDQTGTKLGEVGRDNKWNFVIADYNKDHKPDIIAIKRYGTGTNSTEVHILNGADAYQSYIDQTGTKLGEVGSSNKWDFTVADYNGDFKPDIFAIKRYDTGTNSTEVHILNGADAYQSYLNQTGTKLGEVGSSNKWNFVMTDYNSDCVPDIIAIKRYGTGTNKTEVHILDGADAYQSYLNQTGTKLGEVGSANKWNFCTYMPNNRHILQEEVVNAKKVCDLGSGLFMDNEFEFAEMVDFGDHNIVLGTQVRRTGDGDYCGVLFCYKHNGSYNWVYLKKDLDFDSTMALLTILDDGGSDAVDDWSREKEADGDGFRLSQATLLGVNNGFIIVDRHRNKVIRNDNFYHANINATLYEHSYSADNVNLFHTQVFDVSYGGMHISFAEMKYCFVKGTKVKTQNGLVNIENIEKGDMVSSQNTKTGEKGYKEVTSTSHFNSSQWVEIYTNNEKLTLTRSHPVWVLDGNSLDSGRWMEAMGLDRGMKLIDSKGRVVEITEVRKSYDKMDTYNFEVADWQAYFVSPSEILVHNGGYCEVPVTKLEHPTGAVGSFSVNTPRVIAEGPGPFVYDADKNIILKGETVRISLYNNVNDGYYFQTKLRPAGFRIVEGSKSEAFNNGADQGAFLQLTNVIYTFLGRWGFARQGAPQNHYVPMRGSALNSPNGPPVPHDLNTGVRYKSGNQLMYMRTR